MTIHPHDRKPPVAILGIPFDNVTTLEALQEIEQMLASGQPNYLITANVDFLVQARSDVELRRILLDAHLVVCDGTPLLWASRFLGNPLPERVAGSDLVPLLIQLAEEKHYRLFFLGATPESANTAVTKLQAQYPKLIIAGHYSPPFNKLLEMDHEEISLRIHEAKPDLLFVSFGCPKQEKWISMHYRALGVPVAAGVGATIDFLAGQVRRAPVWMQRSGLEWMFRLAQEPRRLFSRYAKDLWVFGWAILAQWWKLRSRPSRPIPKTNTVTQDESAHWQRIRVPERLDLATVQEWGGSLTKLLPDKRHCLLDMADVKFIDSTGVGLLIRVQKQIRALGGVLVLLSTGTVIQQTLRLMRLHDYFLSATDLATARHLLDSHERQTQSIVSRRTAAATGPLQWHGEVTAANIEEVWGCTTTFLRSLGTAPSVCIDMSEVRFIDSSGLGLMLRTKKFAQANGLELWFTGMQEPVKNVLKIARLENFFQKAQPNVPTQLAPAPTIPLDTFVRANA